MKFRKTKTQLKETRQMVPHNSNKIFRRKVTMKTGQKGKNIMQRLNQNSKKGLANTRQFLWPKERNRLKS